MKKFLALALFFAQMIFFSPTYACDSESSSSQTGKKSVIALFFASLFGSSCAQDCCNAASSCQFSLSSCNSNQYTCLNRLHNTEENLEQLSNAFHSICTNSAKCQDNLQNLTLFRDAFSKANITVSDQQILAMQNQIQEIVNNGPCQSVESTCLSSNASGPMPSFLLSAGLGFLAVYASAPDLLDDIYDISCETIKSLWQNGDESEIF